MTNRTTFQLRPREGTWHVFMIRAQGREIPVDSQHSVFSDRSMSRAQTVCDALNRGLLAGIDRALREAGVKL